MGRSKSRSNASPGGNRPWDEVVLAKTAARGRPAPGGVRWRRRINGADVDAAMQNVVTAEVMMLRLAPTTYTQAIMPSLVEIVRYHLLSQPRARPETAAKPA